jgi:hypothetical protein
MKAIQPKIFEFFTRIVVFLFSFSVDFCRFLSSSHSLITQTLFPEWSTKRKERGVADTRTPDLDLTLGAIPSSPS